MVVTERPFVQNCFVCLKKIKEELEEAQKNLYIRIKPVFV